MDLGVALLSSDSSYSNKVMGGLCLVYKTLSRSVRYVNNRSGNTTKKCHAERGCETVLL